MEEGQKEVKKRSERTRRKQMERKQRRLARLSLYKQQTQSKRVGSVQQNVSSNVEK